MRLVVIAPTGRSLYARLVTHLCAREPGIEVVGIIVRSPWTYKRIRGELRRDGLLLFRKFISKMLLAERAYAADDEENMLGLVRRSGLPGRTLGGLARQLGIPLRVVREYNEPRAIETLRGFAPDVIASTGGGILRGEFLGIPRLGVLNVHLGILPRFRGMDVMEWALFEPGTPAPAWDRPRTSWTPGWTRGRS